MTSTIAAFLASDVAREYVHVRGKTILSEHGRQQKEGAGRGAMELRMMTLYGYSNLFDGIK